MVVKDLIIYKEINNVYIKANCQILIIIKNGKVGGDETKKYDIYGKVNTNFKIGTNINQYSSVKNVHL